MKNNMIAVVIVIVIIASAAAFFGGMKYQQSKTPQRQAGQGQGLRGNAQGNRNGFRPVSGDIIAQDDKSITVKLTDGSSKIILLTNKTAINKADTATKTDLKVGEKVAVFGMDNSDGSVSAQNIQLNPMMRNQNPQ